MIEKKIWKVNGFAGVLLFLIFAGGALLFLNMQQQMGEVPAIGLAVASLLLGMLILSGMTIVQPNKAHVCTFFGTYRGVIREQGFWLTIPLTIRSSISLRAVNFNSEKLKVNDFEGNPIEIAAVIVYRVLDSAKAMYDVNDYVEFVRIQSETGIRHIATQYPYDNFYGEEGISLRKNSDEIADMLAKDLQRRLEVAGVEVIEARIMNLAYSSEIASAMLQRQQATAVLAARKVIVDGAVGLVKSAIEQLAEEGVVELDEEKKAQMVNNLMVSLVSEKGMQPIINSGSIY
ncbi:SPFH domain-containing protein [Bacillus sp. FJAT-42376]|uniref:SPFH domain-containing protein n=1 Tax=Bacillus sp. FJAT-42376 TaxID=2014076 RepID=UPI000F4EAF97|nr:SPFH domain-containing protein [Bacillus sp. FJAT-42376]AZB41937.1 SPFH domain-containing protein [Bacillus sp. FJAT-42376]